MKSQNYDRIIWITIMILLQPAIYLISHTGFDYKIGSRQPNKKIIWDMYLR